MQALELGILDQIALHLRCAPLDAITPILSLICDHGEIWIALALVMLAVRSTRPQGAAVACGLVLDVVACNLLLKPLFHRIRPFLVNTAVSLLVAPPLDASFPSGHTAASFAAVFALKASGSRLWKPALVLAVSIALSRLYLYVHWPSDVLGGAVLGAAMGWLGARLAAWAGEKLREKREKG